MPLSLQPKVPNPAPDGYLRIAYASRGPIWSKWIGEGPEPKAERVKPKKARIDR